MHRIRTLVASLASLTVLAVAGAAHAYDTECENIDISVTNEHPSGDPIKVTRIAYDLDNEVLGWEFEGLGDKVPNQNVTVTWNNQDLGSMPENYATTWRVYYERQLTDGWFPTYGDEVYQEFSRLNHRCHDGDAYSFAIDEWGTDQ
jgi:hypothetical protein